MADNVRALPRPMVEREREVAELARAIRDAQAGVGSVVLVEGEAGIGKSSIVETIRSALPPEGRLLLGEGLTNAEIAARLVVSVRTVDTHVTAILTKLGVPTRRDATRRAAVLGLA